MKALPRVKKNQSAIDKKNSCSTHTFAEIYVSI